MSDNKKEIEKVNTCDCPKGGHWANCKKCEKCIGCGYFLLPHCHKCRGSKSCHPLNCANRPIKLCRCREKKLLKRKNGRTFKCMGVRKE